MLISAEKSSKNRSGFIFLVVLSRITNEMFSTIEFVSVAHAVQVG